MLKETTSYATLSDEEAQKQAWKQRDQKWKHFGNQKKVHMQLRQRI